MKPTINTTQSVLGFLQWQPWSYQPTALNTPTAWQCSALPPGVTFNTTTGRLTGPATMPGVYLVTLTASNADGISDPVVFAIGIEASGYVQPANILEVLIDLNTRRVFIGTTLAELQAQGANAIANTADDKDAKKLSPLCYIKSGDDVIFNVRFVKSGVIAGLSLTALKFALKEFEPEATLIETDGTAASWQQIGSGNDAAYRIYAKIDGDALRGALSNYEDDEATTFLALGEFEWMESNPTTPRIGPATIRGSSRTYGITLTRDLIANN
ncbi:Ig domain-containing protein [Verrucomicrobiota bacterium sgz303538]